MRECCTGVGRRFAKYTSISWSTVTPYNQVNDTDTSFCNSSLPSYTNDSDCTDHYATDCLIFSSLFGTSISTGATGVRLILDEVSHAHCTEFD